MSANPETILHAKTLTECITQMGDLIEDLVAKLSDNEYLSLMNTLKAIYDKQNTNPIIIQAVRQSNMRARRARLTTEQKLLSSDYTTCKKCDRVVLKSGLAEHERSKVCLNTYTSKMVAVQEKITLENYYTDKVNFNQIFNEMLLRRDSDIWVDATENILKPVAKSSFMMDLWEWEESGNWTLEKFMVKEFQFIWQKNKNQDERQVLQYIPWKNKKWKLVQLLDYDDIGVTKIEWAMCPYDWYLMECLKNGIAIPDEDIEDNGCDSLDPDDCSLPCERENYTIIDVWNIYSDFYSP